MENKITAIIPTYSNEKGLFFLINTISSSVKIIIIDNHPTIEKEIIKKKSNCLYLPQNKNTGFAKAVNEGSKHAKNPYLLILNDDIEITDPLIFNKMVEYLEKHHLDAVSPVLKNKSGIIENAGYNVLPIGKVKLNLNVPITSNPIKNIDGLTAACLLIKKDVFDSVKGFDESFFAYLEDVDLFLRLKKKNYQFAVCPTFSVIHNHMTTSSKMGNFKQKQDLKNWIKIIIKNWDRKTFIKYLPFIIFERGKNLSGLIKSTCKK